MPVVPVRVARSCLVPETSLFASIHSQFTAKFFTGSGQLRLFCVCCAWTVMSHENMYNAEKELCRGKLIELEKLNDVKGVGRQQRKAKRPAPPPPETVLCFRDGVFARVSVAAGSALHSSSVAAARESTVPYVADGAELLADLSEEQRNALLNGELLARTLLSSSDFHRPLELEAYRESASARAAPRAAPWARRRKGGSSSRWRQQQREEELKDQLAEAETDEELPAKPLYQPELPRRSLTQPQPVEAQVAYWDPAPAKVAWHMAEVDGEHAPSRKQKRQKCSRRGASRVSFATDDDG